MKKQILNEQFKRMQKLAGLVTESKSKSSSLNEQEGSQVKGTEMFKEYATADLNLKNALKNFDKVYNTGDKYVNQVYDELMETPPTEEIHTKTRAVWYVIFDGDMNGVMDETEAAAKLKKNRGSSLTIDQLIQDGYLERV